MLRKMLRWLWDWTVALAALAFLLFLLAFDRGD